jgi:hypothetical protein
LEEEQRKKNRSYRFSIKKIGRRKVKMEIHNKKNED